MKSNWVFLAFVAVELLLIGLTIGSLTVSGQAADAPHGMVEYWVYRYQTLIVGGGALLGAAMVSAQIREGRKQHEANALRSLRREFEAIDCAELFAKQTLRSSNDTQSDIASMIMDQPRRRYYADISERRLSRVNDYAGEYVADFTMYLRQDIESFMTWQGQGSSEDPDIWGTPVPTFDQRVDGINQSCYHLLSSCQARRSTLFSYVRG
jgi:hypothetical protein